MSESVTLPGTGEPIAVDTVGAAKFQIVKLDGGGDGLSAPLVATTEPPNPDAAGLPVRPLGQQTFAIGFAGSGSILAPELTLRTSGTGVVQNQSSGNLAIQAGTTARAEWLARSLRTFNGAWNLRAQVTIAARIINNNFNIMLADMIGEGLACTINSATSITVTRVAHGLTADNVGQSMFVGAIVGAAGVPGRWAIASIPSVDTINFTVVGWPASGSCTVDLFGYNFARILFTGGANQVAELGTQRRGWSTQTSQAAGTTNSPGSVFQMQSDGRNVYLSDVVPTSVTIPISVTRANRTDNLPDENTPLYLYIWSQNGATAPASNQTMTIGFISVEEMVNQTFFMGGMRMLGSQAPLPVVQQGNINVSALAGGTNNIGRVTPAPDATIGAGTHFSLITLAGTNEQLILTASRAINSMSFSNPSATGFWVKLYNFATIPVLASTVPTLRYWVPAGQTVVPDCGPFGIRFPTGLGVALTGLVANTDASAVAAGCVVNISYT